MMANDGTRPDFSNLGREERAQMLAQSAFAALENLATVLEAQGQSIASEAAAVRKHYAVAQKAAKQARFEGLTMPKSGPGAPRKRTSLVGGLSHLQALTDPSQRQGVDSSPAESPR
eukprot:TRINITY_DN11500_c1_g1_i1.p2 TRINITY_DN11500_c1_g1~~TRINITY_DN11500_c1_g1_i1.p2  ORF type:complete len:116 (-),score=24.54 TRINITY_DN11500_c1_g1_i1:409-756(-)